MFPTGAVCPAFVALLSGVPCILVIVLTLLITFLIWCHGAILHAPVVTSFRAHGSLA